MLPRATENAVAGHMRPAGLQLDHTALGKRHYVVKLRSHA